jgi:hypothetical protein
MQSGITIGSNYLNRFLPGVGSSIRRILTDAVGLLKPAGANFAAPIDRTKLIIGQLGPSHAHLASELLPDSLEAIPIHRCAPTRGFECHPASRRPLQ